MRMTCHAASMIDVKAERAICHRFAERIRAYGMRHLRNESAAKDLVQVVLLAVLQALREGRVADPERLDAYVSGTCRNAAMDLRRGAIRQERVASQSATLLPNDYEPPWETVDVRRLE